MDLLATQAACQLRTMRNTAGEWVVISAGTIPGSGSIAMEMVVERELSKSNKVILIGTPPGKSQSTTANATYDKFMNEYAALAVGNAKITFIDPRSWPVGLHA